ncbi:serine threonine [Pyrrhoderma noxium]|uniref:non-specific serine/threonine protein kinase n=1 Tax=Pyrrhoderma noxium TaxID=2282107 RepID=A0A286UTD3_9AGAM|nr:serine threonine [Pyrrhoderma noxium]
MYAQNTAKGTLMPGQMISVNKYNVQVEKYLSQGGFAYVYLVRTAEPVYGTTHHVLKRIAVANEAMLNDVKKEVDIMRILRGHPNIVYLIDAAWHRMPNGMFEVFILMEFCSGGGIIDMMNRRLRERLTEAEILQIFVDVCEGVAAMHNLRPALLHRDLKVENILQASATSYKLCDFGSAMPVASRPPSTTQEIRALEADLNKHTTLQYRAPEMVDVYLRRPVDEKSDVWALGVLLYKLCYYTTPFEEHGVLAILNVQYKFPPYPVYSQQLMSLIASMLREHNVHRPSVFEILDTVHTMRGTKSRFTYTPPPKQVLSPRSLPDPLSPVATKNQAASIKSPDSTGSRMNGIQAREKVLEAIAPMRRGRPSSPSKGRIDGTSDAFNLLDTIEGGPWNSKPAKAHKSGLAAINTTKSPPPMRTSSNDLGDAWKVPNMGKDKTGTADSTGGVHGFTDAFNGIPSVSSSVPPIRPSVTQRPISSLRPPGDAFESLNVFPSPKSSSLTLGEAQKAAVSAPRLSPSPQPSSQRYAPSPTPSFKSPSPLATGNIASLSAQNPSPSLKPKSSNQALDAEQRFPSLEELDAGNFGPVSNVRNPLPAPTSKQSHSPIPPQLPPRPGAGSRQGSVTSFYPPGVSAALLPKSYTGTRGTSIGGNIVSSTRGLIQRDAPVKMSPPISAPSRQEKTDPPREKLSSPSRPLLPRKHRSSISIKPAPSQGTGTKSRNASPEKISTSPTKDWLTGAEETHVNNLDTNAVLRASPEKRTSIQHISVPPKPAQEAVRATSPIKRKPVPVHRPTPIELKNSSPSVIKEMEKKGSLFGSGALTENWSPISPRSSSSDDADEGPEDAVGFRSIGEKPAKDVVGQHVIGHKTRQGSVHDLVDLWGGSQSPKPSPARFEKRSLLSSSANVSSPNLSTGSNLTTQKKPSSAIALPGLSSRTSTPQQEQQRPLPSKPAAPLSRKPSLTSRNTATGNQTLRQPSPGPISRQRTPSPSRVRSTRPQSMMILPSSTPVQKSVSEQALVSPSLSPMITSSKSALAPPVNKSRASQRRSSISSLVSKFEAIDAEASGLPAPAPVPASKPARLLSSSPASSPRAFAKSLDLSESGGVYSLTKERESSFTLQNLSRPGTPQRSPHLPPKDLISLETNISETAPTRAQMDRKPLNALQAALSAREREKEREREQVERDTSLLISPISTSTPAGLGTVEQQRSPSPERPFQGVSRLIDQWQKKSEESGSGSGKGVKSTGAGAGTGSRFRREGMGITAGGPSSKTN